MTLTRRACDTDSTLTQKNDSGTSLELRKVVPLSSEIFGLCGTCDLLLFVSYFASQSKGITFGDYFFHVSCVG